MSCREWMKNSSKRGDMAADLWCYSPLLLLSIAVLLWMIFGDHRYSKFDFGRKTHDPNGEVSPLKRGMLVSVGVLLMIGVISCIIKRIWFYRGIYIAWRDHNCNGQVVNREDVLTSIPSSPPMAVNPSAWVSTV